MINELGRSPTRSENVYFANNEQASIDLFYNLFYKFNLYSNWSAQAVDSNSECSICEIQRNQSNLVTFKNCPMNQLWLKHKAHVIEITKACIVAFIKARNSLVVWCREKKETVDGENVFFKAVAKVFLLKLLFVVDLLPNRLHEKVMVWYIIMLYY